MNLTSARTKHILSQLWTDSCTVIEYADDPRADGSTGSVETVALENQPCKLSFSTLPAVGQDADVATSNQVIKLFLDPAVKIKPGSKIIVTRGTDSFIYAQSGEPGIFHNHQEITLVSWEKYP